MKNTAILFYVFISIILFSTVACTKKNIPKKKIIINIQDVKFPAHPTKSKSIVYIFRPNSIRGNFKHDIFIDNAIDSENYVGYNMGGEYIYFYLSPGKHRIHSHAAHGAWIDIAAKRGKMYFVKQLIQQKGERRNSMKFIDIRSAKLFIIKLRRGKIVKLDH